MQCGTNFDPRRMISDHLYNEVGREGASWELPITAHCQCLLAWVQGRPADAFTALAAMVSPFIQVGTSVLQHCPICRHCNTNEGSEGNMSGVHCTTHVTTARHCCRSEDAEKAGVASRERKGPEKGVASVGPEE